MGYQTDLFGTLKLNKQLSLDDKNFLTKFAETRRMARNLDPKYGVEGEFYVDGDMNGFDDPTVIDYNRPPRTQPGLWCQWIPTEDGWGIEWDGNEKFYNYVEWLEYIVANFLEPKGYKLNGQVEWRGEESDDRGTIVVVDNAITTRAVGDDGESATRVFFVTDGPMYDEDDDPQNEELFETLEAAEAHAETMTDPRIRVCIVRNAYREDDGSWNYDDQADTFETIKTLTEE